MINVNFKNKDLIFEKNENSIFNIFGGDVFLDNELLHVNKSFSFDKEEFGVSMEINGTTKTDNNKYVFNKEGRVKLSMYSENINFASSLNERYLKKMVKKAKLFNCFEISIVNWVVNGNKFFDFLSGSLLQKKDCENDLSLENCEKKETNEKFLFNLNEILKINCSENFVIKDGFLNDIKLDFHYKKNGEEILDVSIGSTITPTETFLENNMYLRTFEDKAENELLFTRFIIRPKQGIKLIEVEYVGKDNGIYTERFLKSKIEKTAISMSKFLVPENKLTSKVSLLHRYSECGWNLIGFDWDFYYLGFVNEEKYELINEVMSLSYISCKTNKNLFLNPRQKNIEFIERAFDVKISDLSENKIGALSYLLRNLNSKITNNSSLQEKGRSLMNQIREIFKEDNEINNEIYHCVKLTTSNAEILNELEVSYIKCKEKLINLNLLT